MTKKNLHLNLVWLAVLGFIILFSVNNSKAQSVAINATGAAADPSAMLDVSSTTKGLLIPRMTIAQRHLILPVTGLMVYQTDGLNGFYYFNGLVWELISTGTNFWTLNGSGSSIYNINPDSRVGIGTNLPRALMDVAGSVVFTGSSIVNGALPVSGYGGRMMWYANKNAFRVGQITHTEWDDANIGENSVATGFNTVALGQNSTALGEGSVALDRTSTAIGWGDSAIGYGTTAIGNYARAMNRFSTSIGSGTTARGDYSFALGSYNDTSNILTSYFDPRLFQLGNGRYGYNSNAITVLWNANTGIGNIYNPVEKLEVDGAIKIGDASSTPANGTIRYTSSGFEGRHGSTWIPLGGGSGSPVTIPVYWTANGGHIFNTNTANVGIGTNSPSAKFQVSYGSVVFDNAALTTPAGAPPITGAGNRMMWYSDKAAFRAGGVGYSEWDAAHIGNYSIGLGYGSTAEGTNSFATGYQSSALGNNSTALGYTTYARGSSSTSMGFWTNALGDYSTAMGHYTGATGSVSTALGEATSATGNTSTAMGNQSVARGDFSLAAGQFNKAKAYAATAIGMFNDTTDAPLSYSTNQDRLFQIGNGKTDNSRSNAFTILSNGNVGLGNILVPEEQLELTAAIKIGNTSSVSAADGTIRHTASGFEGRHGGAWVPFTASSSGGSGSTGLWAANGTHIYNTNTDNVGIGTNTPTAKLQVANGSVVFNGPAPIPDIPTETPPVSGAGSRMMWYANKAAFRAGIVSGTEWDNSNLGKYSTAFGYSTQATNAGSFALGFNSIASGVGSFAGGSGAVSNNDKTFAYGSSVTASGAGSIAMGLGTTASGNYSTAMGLGSTAQGQSSFCLGVGTVSKALNSFVIGEYNDATDLPAALTPAASDRLFQLGNGTSTANHNAMTVFRSGFVGIGTMIQSFPADFLEVNGKIGSTGFSTLSDRRYKTNIKTIDNGLNKILKLRGVTYDWDKSKADKNLDNKNHIGFIAQELEEVLPQIVNVGEDAQKTRTVDYLEVIPVLVEAIKDQQKEIKDQQNEIDALKKALTAKDTAFAQRLAALEAMVLDQTYTTGKKVTVSNK